MTAENVAADLPTDDEAQVLTFTLGAETYCVAIDYVAEIVDGGELTALPDSADHVEGVMDLRGETTTIVNPFTLFGTDTDALVTDGGLTESRIIVLDSESVGAESPVGWLVSEVHTVKTISTELLETDAIGENTLLRGVLSDDDGFTLWVKPHGLLA
jgi:purine-binding chemotaxis protein CheW